MKFPYVPEVLPRNLETSHQLTGTLVPDVKLHVTNVFKLGDVKRNIGS